MTDTLPGPILEAFQKFNQMTDERYHAGAQKYGSLEFLDQDTIEMALEELADLSNYARFTFAKLYLLRQALAESAQERLDAAMPPPMLGARSVVNPYGE